MMNTVTYLFLLVAIFATVSIFDVMADNESSATADPASQSKRNLLENIFDYTRRLQPTTPPSGYNPNKLLSYLKEMGI
ncbi:hypothetical protein CAJAP_08883 [Camponotus japonicus]